MAHQPPPCPLPSPAPPGRQRRGYGDLWAVLGFLISGTTAIFPQHTQVAPRVVWDGNT